MVELKRYVVSHEQLHQIVDSITTISIFFTSKILKYSTFLSTLTFLVRQWKYRVKSKNSIVRVKNGL